MDFVACNFAVQRKKKYNKNNLHDLKLCIFSHRNIKLRRCLVEKF